MLRVIRRIRETAPLAVRATFLGAHAVPRAYVGRQEEYVDLVCNEMLPAVAAEGLADFVDVFCDEGFFTVEQTARIMKAGRKLGMTRQDPRQRTRRLGRCAGGRGVRCPVGRPPRTHGGLPRSEPCTVR